MTNLINANGTYNRSAIMTLAWQRAREYAADLGMRASQVFIGALKTVWSEAQTWRRVNAMTAANHNAYTNCVAAFVPLSNRPQPVVRHQYQEAA